MLSASPNGEHYSSLATRPGDNFESLGILPGENFESLAHFLYLAHLESQSTSSRPGHSALDYPGSWQLPFRLRNIQGRDVERLWG